MAGIFVPKLHIYLF